jgi:hypothetical protein
MLQMRTLTLTLALGAAFLPSSSAQSSPATGGSADVRWQTYIDPGHGTAVEFPAGIFSVDAGAPERGSGRAFRTRDGRARLVIYTLPNQERHSPQEYLRRHLLIFPGNLDYSRVTRRFFAISGVRSGQVFYSRCNFPQVGGGDMRCIFLQYPERETKAWDRIVTKISLSLRGAPSAMASGGGKDAARGSRRR